MLSQCCIIILYYYFIILLIYSINACNVIFNISSHIAHILLLKMNTVKKQPTDQQIDEYMDPKQPWNRSYLTGEIQLLDRV